MPQSKVSVFLRPSARRGNREKVVSTESRMGVRKTGGWKRKGRTRVRCVGTSIYWLLTGNGSRGKKGRSRKRSSNMKEQVINKRLHKKRGFDLGLNKGSNEHSTTPVENRKRT